MLAYVMPEGRGIGDRLLFEVAETLRADGLRLAGAVQTNADRDDGRPCDMDLHILTGGTVMRISQRLGVGASGCRLDPDGLERAVGLALAALGDGIDLVVVNKFGKQEAVFGRGFRPLFAAALDHEIPLITSLTPGMREAFLDFAGDLATPLPAEQAALLAWARQAAAGQRASVPGAAPG